MKRNILEARMKKCLGEEMFDYMYNVFVSFLNDDRYQYKFIKARRAYVLFEVFLALFEEQYQDAYQSDFQEDYKEYLNKIFNDYALGYNGLLKKIEENNTNVLIFDDIIIHGRALSKLVQGIKNVNTSAFSLFQNQYAEQISPDLELALNKCNTLISFNENSRKLHNIVDWEEVSNKIVSTIQQCGVCYSAFVPQFNAETDTMVLSDDIIVGDSIKLRAFDLNNLSMRTYWDKTERSAMHIMLRKYVYHSDDTVFVPLVILPTLSVTSWRTCYSNLWHNFVANGLLDETSEQTLMGVVNKNKSNSERDAIEYSYRLTTYILSMLSFYRFKSIMNLRIKDASIGSSRFSFSDDIFTIIKGIYNKIENTSALIIDNVLNDFDSCLAKNIVDTRITYTPALYVFEEVMDKLSGAEKKQFDRSISDKLISDYIDKVHQMNEQGAKERKDRLQGASLDMMLSLLDKKFKIKREQKEYFLSRLCAKWDCGAASYVVECYENGSTIGGGIIDGEQAYYELIPEDSDDEIDCFYKIYEWSDRNMALAQQRYANLICWMKNSYSSLCEEKMEMVSMYFQRRHSIEALKILYPEKMSTPNVKSCLQEFKRSW